MGFCCGYVCICFIKCAVILIYALSYTNFHESISSHANNDLSKVHFIAFTIGSFWQCVFSTPPILCFTLVQLTSGAQRARTHCCLGSIDHRFTLKQLWMYVGNMEITKAFKTTLLPTDETAAQTNMQKLATYSIVFTMTEFNYTYSQTHRFYERKHYIYVSTV